MEYKEKLEEAKRLYESATADQRYTLESLFPEIRESEDEKIRREIINYFNCQSRDEPSRKDTHNKWIAWLEKVIIPSHNDIDSSFIEDIKNVISEAPLLMQSNKEKMITWLEKQGEQKQDANIQINPSEYINDMGGNGCYLKNATQVSAWSEEDEHRVKDTIYFLDTAKKHYASTVELDACIDWLETLKQRIGE